MTSDLASSIRAQTLDARGRRQKALAVFEGIEREIWYNVALASPFWAQTLERFLLAELLLEFGRDDEAIPWYSSISQIAPFEVAYRALSHLRLGTIYDRKGDAARAAEHYRRFIELWSDADPELQVHVEAARRALAKIAPDV